MAWNKKKQKIHFLLNVYLCRRLTYCVYLIWPFLHLLETGLFFGGKKSRILPQYRVGNPNTWVCIFRICVEQV